MIVRPASAADAAAITAIWNPLIRETTVTFTPDEKSPEDVARLIAEGAAAGHGAFVAEDGGVAGFAFYGQFRHGRGYAFTMEHTVHVAEGARGRGTGRALMAAIERQATYAGAHTLFAGVSGENAGGQAFHAALGYGRVAILPEVGFKFGRWIDLHLMHKRLAHPA